MDERTAGGRGLHAPAPAGDERDPSRRFHAAEAFARRGERHVRAAGACGDAAGLHDVKKQPEIGQIETHREP
ncbi:hypothetical protein GCM10008179_08800 [Hansschlegelia plantiphila]|uniref:Uncharacterized protein n=1 Tax=Hansschlegelia plantiphila TaxID=374655 RepID=A0A9W6MUS3_9HYPH|nr:hypothetical protein GCM10008179_08800 [Hansschlegelia plantiphila]